MHPSIEKAYRILDGQPLDYKDALELILLKGDDTLDLISLAHKIKLRYRKGNHICSIINAKSGKCSEDCRFCAQSSHYDTSCDAFPMLDTDTIVKEACIAYEAGITHFGIVTSGFGYPEYTDEFQKLISVIDIIKNELPSLEVCASLGVLGEDTAKALCGKGIAHYNHNIQVTPEKYGELVSLSHTVTRRINTVKLIKKYGANTCCGGIFGIGETPEERVELAFALRDMDIDIIPLNVLIPIKGTPYADYNTVSAFETVKAFAVMRLVNPDKIIKFGAGRETVMKDFQGLIMLIADGFISGGYLTVRGRSVEEDKRLLYELSAFD
jgi:biotin synthase